MDTAEWAKREVQIACERQAKERKDEEWDYGCACLKSALKGYLRILEDNHSGLSFGITRRILQRLMKNLPLTPIEDTPDVWSGNQSKNDKTGETTCQCSRMPSLFKTVHPDGKVTYSDIDRTYTYDRSDPDGHWRSGLGSRIVDELFPIPMPYYPPEGEYAVACETYLTDRENGDYDTRAYLFVTAPDGTVTQINRYFGEIEGRWTEISKEDFDARVAIHNRRIKREFKEKVVKGLKVCDPANYPASCKECPYKDFAVLQPNDEQRCRIALLRDLLEILAEEQPRVMTLEEVKAAEVFWIEDRTDPDEDGLVPDICPATITMIHSDEWELMIKGLKGTVRIDEYGETWRCWTSRPTEKQAREVEWK